MFNTVSMIGLGYIGLPTAAILASRKIKVVGVDVNSLAVETINKGRIHIIEPELDMIVSAAVSQGYLRATTVPVPADAFLIAVPTPFMGDHQPDISFVRTAAVSIAPVIKKGDLIILESTSPVGTTERMSEWLAQERPDLSFPHQKGEVADINIAYCPERVLPGKVVRELVNNDRVIGGMTPRCSQKAIELYKIFVEGECIKTDSRTAEMCKLIENSYRDVNIAFANEISMICESLDINVWELIKLANRHPRVNILQPGPGVGGHCIAVDPWFIVAKNPNEANLIRMARRVNDLKPKWVLNMVTREVDKYLASFPKLNPADINIACFGISFKPDIDDLRESPSLEIATELSKSCPGKLLVVEPNIECLPSSVPNNMQLVNVDEVSSIAQIAVILVPHTSFHMLPKTYWEKLVIIDACGLNAV